MTEVFCRTAAATPGLFTIIMLFQYFIQNQIVIKHFKYMVVITVWFADTGVNIFILEAVYFQGASQIHPLNEAND